MILFDGDYQKQGAVPNYGSKNRSWVKMSHVLRNMGVKNHSFFLALHDTSLLHVDPHSDSLTEEQTKRIMIECKTNPWYFFRECIKLNESGTKINYRLNRANLALMWIFFNCLTVFLVMPRQIGKTVGACAIHCYNIYIVGLDVEIGLFAKDNTQRTDLIKKTKTIRDGLPKWMIDKRRGDPDNLEAIGYEALGNKVTTFVNSSDPKTAAGQGRGFTFAYTHTDEFAYYKNNHLSFDSYTSATNAGMPAAWRSGMRCANILTTTAGYISTKAGQYAFKTKNDCLRFNERYYDVAGIEELESIMKDGSKNRMFYLEYNHKQLGLGAEWWDRVTAGKDEVTIDVDFRNKWVSMSSATVLDKQILAELLKNKKDPVMTSLLDSMVFNWYVDPKILFSKEFVNKPFILGNDISDNVGEDYTTLTLIDPYDMSVIGTARTNSESLGYVAKTIITVMEKFPRAIWIPEKNRSGLTLIDYVTMHFKGNGVDLWKRIFNYHIQDYDPNNVVPMSKLDVDNPTTRKKLGFNTGAKSRTELYRDILPLVAKLNMGKIHDHTIIDEMSSLSVKNGRIDHSAGAHDDQLISYLLACWMVLRGKNLHLYGIDTDRELLVNVDKESETAFEDGQKERIMELRRQVRELEDALSNPNLNPLFRSHWEKQLKDLKREIPSDYQESSAVSLAKTKAEVKQNKPKIHITNSHIYDMYQAVA